MNTTLMLGDLEIGIFETMNVDGFWCYGRFRQGQHFSTVAGLLHELENAYNKEDLDAADKMQGQVDGLGLEQFAGGARSPVLGFKLSGGEYEFRA